MNDLEVNKVINRAKLTASREGLQQLDKENAEENRKCEFEKRIAALEKISSELHKSNELAIKQAEEAKAQSIIANKSAFWSSVRAWISIGISVVSVFLSLLLHFLG